MCFHFCLVVCLSVCLKDARAKRIIPYILVKGIFISPHQEKLVLQNCFLTELYFCFQHLDVRALDVSA